MPPLIQQRRADRNPRSACRSQERDDSRHAGLHGHLDGPARTRRPDRFVHRGGRADRPVLTLRWCVQPAGRRLGRADRRAEVWIAPQGRSAAAQPEAVWRVRCGPRAERPQGTCGTQEHEPHAGPRGARPAPHERCVEPLCGHRPPAVRDFSNRHRQADAPWARGRPQGVPCPDNRTRLKFGGAASRPCRSKTRVSTMLWPGSRTPLGRNTRR
jgi:hypothetical protein